MYSIITDYFAYWLGVTVFSGLIITFIAVFGFQIETSVTSVSLIAGASIILGLLSLVMRLRKKRSEYKKQ